jgi:hypothetical protein
MNSNLVCLYTMTYTGNDGDEWVGGVVVVVIVQ